MKVGGYTAGSIYKRFYGTNMSQMNRAAVASASSAMSSYGDSIFSTNVTQSQSLSQLVVQQYAAKVTADAQAKMQSAAGITNLLSSLGAASDS